MADNSKEIKRLHEKMLQAMNQDGVFATPGVETAFSAVPRHLFLPDFKLEDVYSDRAIGLKEDGAGLLIASSSQPSMMAIMLNQMQLQAGDNVLEIGTATGYNAAIMQHIVGNDGKVTSIEIDKELADKATKNLQSAHASRVTVVHADGAQGYAPRAAYDHILSTVGVWDVPPAWLTQLKPKGAVVVPILVDGVQVSAKFKRMPDGTFLSDENHPCAFVYMQGQNAGPSFRKQVGTVGMYILADEVDKIDTAGLNVLLSNDHEYCQFEKALQASDYWYGYQLYLMVNEPQNYIFFTYAVYDGQTAYGIEGRGIGLFTRSSAALAGYGDNGSVHCFAGSDSFLEMQTILDDWLAKGKLGLDKLRLRLIPKEAGKPEIERGKVYERHEHFLHVWFEVE